MSGFQTVDKPCVIFFNIVVLHSVFEHEVTQHFYVMLGVVTALVVIDGGLNIFYPYLGGFVEMKRLAFFISYFI